MVHLHCSLFDPRHDDRYGRVTNTGAIVLFLRALWYDIGHYFQNLSNLIPFEYLYLQGEWIYR